MTNRQMVRALRKWKISLVYNHLDQSWYAGVCASQGALLEVNVKNTAVAGAIHIGTKPEEAVEDYCNARDLEWDV